MAPEELNSALHTSCVKRIRIYPGRWCIKYFLLVFLSGLFPAAQADDISVAVATNFLSTLKSLTQRFEANSGHHVSISSGSTGKLFAQIQHGAPFDIFLAADAERPRLLEEQGLAIKGSRFTYAIGQLALWSPQAQLINAEGKVLKNGKFHHLAIANPKIAPYGNAAKQVLAGMGLWETLQPHLVQGEDIGQTFQFVASGNAELGFVAYSQILSLSGADKGSHWLIPQGLYAPLEQQAVLLTRAASYHAARDFLVYLQSAEAGVIIKQQGYDISGPLIVD